MKLIVKPVIYSDSLKKYDGIILPLKDFSINYDSYFTLDDIKDIRNKYDGEIFVVINKMIFNKDLDSLKNVLLDIDKIGVTGIFYYDVSVLEFKKELNLKADLVWNANHMVTNYETCNYYFSKGVKYAYLSNEITLDETLEINKKSSITPMFTMVSKPVVGTSFRHLLTNYYKAHNKEFKNNLSIKESKTKEEFIVSEENDGTTFRFNKILNNTRCLKKLKDNNFPYLVFIEDSIDSDKFYRALDIINDYVKNDIDNLKDVYDLLGRNTGFSYRKTIYRVKKHEKN